MTNEPVRIVQGDRARPLVVTLLGPDGPALNLTGETIKFRMVTSANVVKIEDEEMVAVDASAGVFKYQWTAGSVDTVGTFKAWVIRVAAGNLFEHFPGDGSYIRVKIAENITGVP